MCVHIDVAAAQQVWDRGRVRARESKGESVTEGVQERDGTSMT